MGRYSTYSAYLHILNILHILGILHIGAVRTDRRVEIEGSTRGPRGPKNA